MRVRKYIIIPPENGHMVKFKPFVMRHDNKDHQDMFVYFPNHQFLSTPVSPPSWI